MEDDIKIKIFQKHNFYLLTIQTIILPPQQKRGFHIFIIKLKLKLSQVLYILNGFHITLNPVKNIVDVCFLVL